MFSFILFVSVSRNSFSKSLKQKKPLFTFYLNKKKLLYFNGNYSIIVINNFTSLALSVSYLAFSLILFFSQKG